MEAESGRKSAYRRRSTDRLQPLCRRERWLLSDSHAGQWSHSLINIDYF